MTHTIRGTCLRCVSYSIAALLLATANSPLARAEAEEETSGDADASASSTSPAEKKKKTEVEQLTVTDTWESPEYPALPEVEGTRINSGKKTSLVKPEEFPAVTNNDYREVTATTPGLIVSEEPTSPIINFGYRGLDSQRSEFMQVLKDGVSIKNEQFGFPETHYTPILDAVDEIEFIRSGAALQYGPQPGGALNFVTKMPRRDAPFHLVEKNAFGTDQLYTNFTALDGTVGDFGYYGYYDHREREGFRWSNSDYDVNAGSARAVFDVTDDSALILTFDAYEEEHGEPGGLRRRGDPRGDPVVGDPGIPAGSIPRYYEDDRDATTRLFDRFRLSRYYGVLDFRKLVSERTQLDLKAFGGYLARWSKRQLGGDVGIQPDPAAVGAAGTNDIQQRSDYTEGAEARLRHDYDLFSDVSTFAGGLYFYHAEQDRFDRRGVTAAAQSGPSRRRNTGETYNGSLFAENRFHWDRLSITPGMRLEFLGQSLNESKNITKTTVPLGDRSDFSLVPLFGVGVGYVLLEGEEVVAHPPAADERAAESGGLTAPAVGAQVPPRLELYGNVSQAYRPITYGELIPTSATGVANSDLEEGHSLQGEVGLRGRPLRYLAFDTSGFWYELKDLVNELTVANPSPPPATIVETRNVGDADYWGFEAATELDILGAISGDAESPWGSFNLYGNVTLLDAEFTSGPFEDNVPSYAPDYQFKTGAIYRWEDVVKIGLIGTIVDDHFATANHDFQFAIPSYDVWDLTAEVKFWDGRIGVFGGVKNLFDEDFWAEVRDEGIVPAYGRNYYGGFEFFWRAGSDCWFCAP